MTRRPRLRREPAARRRRRCSRPRRARGHRHDPTRPAPERRCGAARQASSTAARARLQARHNGWRDCARHEASSSPRSTGRPAHPRVDVARDATSGGKRRGQHVDPEPEHDVRARRVADDPASARMPASFRPPAIHVVGPLHARRRARWPPGCLRRSRRRRRSSSAGHVRARAQHDRDVQARTGRRRPARPCRPRPAVCASATTTQPFFGALLGQLRGDVVGGRHFVVAMDVPGRHAPGVMRSHGSRRRQRLAKDLRANCVTAGYMYHAARFRS